MYHIFYLDLVDDCAQKNDLLNKAAHAAVERGYTKILHSLLHAGLNVKCVAIDPKMLLSGLCCCQCHIR